MQFEAGLLLEDCGAVVVASDGVSGEVVLVLGVEDDWLDVGVRFSCS